MSEEEGHEDPYLWMENLDDPRVREFIDKENQRFKEFVGVLPEILIHDVRRYYYMPSIIDGQITDRGIYLLKQRANRFLIELLHWDGEKSTILDSKDIGDDVIVVGIEASDDGRTLAYSFSRAGSDITTVRILDTESNEVIDELVGSIWNIVFLDTNKYYYTKFFRTEKTPDGVEPPASRVFLREEGKDSMVFGEGLGTNYFVGLAPSINRDRSIVVVSYGWSESKIYGGPLEEPSKWVPIFGVEGYPVSPIDYVDGKYYVVAYDGEGMGRVLIVSEDGDAKELIPEDRYPLRHAAMVNSRIIAEYLVEASSILRIYDLNGKLLEEIRPEAPSTISILSRTKDRALLRQETFWVPYKLLLYRDGKFDLIDEFAVRGEYEVLEDYATSKDGTRIHYFLVKKKGTNPNRLLVFGYGGFRIALTPRFLKRFMKFVADGGGFVMANLRGGSEYGEKWHREGMRDKKQNVFDDFIAVLEKLKSEGYKVIAHGRSNGGLLVSAVITQRPDIVDIAVIGYPVIDMLRFHKLYIGRAWIPEYGDPDDPKDREFLLKYSPYHNVKSNLQYPLTLIYTGLHDDRVHPAHALKFTARLKEVNAPVFLRVETKSGHIGADPETRIREIADILAFIYAALLRGAP